jgi:hypothetical protein
MEHKMSKENPLTKSEIKRAFYRYASKQEAQFFRAKISKPENWNIIEVDTGWYLLPLILKVVI